MIISYKNSRIKVPDFLIVGAPRAGTTSLYSYLSRHPGIFMPKEKEPMFFYAWEEPPFYVDRSKKKTASYIRYQLKDYLKLFLTAKGSDIIGEASTWYLRGYQKAIPNIRRIYGEQSGEIKIIIMLRNPVERAWSHYCLKRNLGGDDLDFEEAIRPDVIQTRLSDHLELTFDYVGMGMYSQPVKAYLENFKQVKIFLFEEFIKDFSKGFSDLLQFLGVEAVPLGYDYKKLNVSGFPKNAFVGVMAKFIFRPNVIKSLMKPLFPFGVRKNMKNAVGNKIFIQKPLAWAARETLLDHYREDILQLEKVIGKDLQFWLNGSYPSQEE